jgi:RluA family pseudouridine synthase
MTEASIAAPRACEPLHLGRDLPEVPVLFEDEHLLAVDKPAELLVAPDRWDPARPNLMGALHAAMAERRPWTLRRGYVYAANAHRLDYATSGVLLLARSRPMLVRLARLFQERRMAKSYLGLTRGTPAERTFTISTPLAPDPARPGRTRVDRKHGRPASTAVEVLEAFRDFALVRALPATGRQHQIRVHLAHAGCPLVADPEYGDGIPLRLSRLKRDYKLKAEGERPLMGRTALHAESLEFEHPVTGHPLRLEAPLPRDFSTALKSLRRYA